MVITPDFVYVHLPKTGGTFVTETLMRVYGEGDDTGDDTAVVNTNKHGTCSEIPPEARHLPIVSTVRNPFDRYVSQYRFGWWKLHPELYCGEEEMRRAYPEYPDLTFAEFVRLANEKFTNCYRQQETGYRNDKLVGEEALGWHTEQFIRFYCHQPKEVFAGLTEESLADGSWQEHLFDVTFLPVENLNRSLHDFLIRQGQAPDRVRFILDTGRIYPEEGGRAAEDAWQDYYDPQTLDFIRKRERLLFLRFPAYDPLVATGSPTA